MYGQHEEYLFTIKGDLLDEVDGTSLYDCRINLKKLQSEILLKVKTFKDNKTFQIFNILIIKVLQDTRNEHFMDLRDFSCY